MNIKYLHPADQIVMIMDRIYQSGMTTTSGGNLSIMDSDGVMWISPSGIDKGNLKREDICRVYPDGRIEGIHKPSVEYPFHANIYKTRPDIKAVLHAHPPALVSLSLVRQIPNTQLLPNASIVCGKVGMADYALPGSKKLGENIAAEFAKGYNTVMLENHGVCMGADDLLKAFMMFEVLDFNARLQIRALTIGQPKTLNDTHMSIYAKKTTVPLEEYTPMEFTSRELELRRDMCTLIHRAYRNELFTSGQGTFSARLSGNNFVITPYSIDRNYLEPSDMVRIENGKREAGKTPSRSVLLHQAIYEKHPDINSVIIAHPPNIMAFAITDVDFDARLIPESYIALKNVQRMPFGWSILEPDMVAERISMKNPVIMVENDSVIVSGNALLDAFDKIEVLEYSARSVIYTKQLGKIIPINDEQVEEIEVAFKLK